MEILILTLFVSLSLALLGVGFFVWSVVRGTGEQSDRLALLPLEPEAVHAGAPEVPLRSHTE